MRTRVDLDDISIASSQNMREQSSLHEELQSSLVHHHDRLADSLAEAYQHVDERISNVEELLKSQSKQLQERQSSQIGPFYRRTPHHQGGSSRATGQKLSHSESSNTDGVGVRVTQYKACHPGCVCKCHSQTRASTPNLVDHVLGQMFMGYSGLPLLSPKCNLDSCTKSESPHVNVEYWFPLGFAWSQILRLRLTYQPNFGPHLELNTLRRVPDSAQCVNFALNGNIEGLKDLFIRGLASPRDVSSTRGYSVLRVS